MADRVAGREESGVKPRRVVLTLEFDSEEPVAELRRIASAEMRDKYGNLVASIDEDSMQQVQANVIGKPRKAKA